MLGHLQAGIRDHPLALGLRVRRLGELEHVGHGLQQDVHRPGAGVAQHLLGPIGEREGAQLGRELLGELLAVLDVAIGPADLLGDVLGELLVGLDQSSGPQLVVDRMAHRDSRGDLGALQGHSVQASLEHAQRQLQGRICLRRCSIWKAKLCGLFGRPRELLSDSLGNQSVVLIGDCQSARGRPIANIGHRSVVELVLLLSRQLEFNVENLGDP
jgi:hypothetical protein